MTREFIRLVVPIFAVLVSSIPTSVVMPLGQVLTQTRVYIDPSGYLYDADVNGTIGTRFNVTVRVENVEDLAAFQVCVVYNDTIINVTRWYEPAWDPEYVFHGKTTIPVYKYTSIAPGNGSAMGGATLFPPPPSQPAFTGNGLLCILEFNITAVPLEGETYSCELAIDKTLPYDTYLLDTPSDEIPCTKENGYYEIVRCIHVQMGFVEGWNLIDMPLEPANAAIEVVFAGNLTKVEVIWGYNQTWSQWIYPGVGNLTELHAGVGYWVLADEAFNQTLVGTVPAEAPPLVEGWNLMGITGRDSVPTEDYLAGSVWTAVFGYVEKTESWVWKIRDVAGSLTTLEPGEGYWIKI